METVGEGEIEENLKEIRLLDRDISKWSQIRSHPGTRKAGQTHKMRLSQLF